MGQWGEGGGVSMGGWDGWGWWCPADGRQKKQHFEAQKPTFKADQAIVLMGRRYTVNTYHTEITYLCHLRHTQPHKYYSQPNSVWIKTVSAIRTLINSD